MKKGILFMLFPVILFSCSTTTKFAFENKYLKNTSGHIIIDSETISHVIFYNDCEIIIPAEHSSGTDLRVQKGVLLKKDSFSGKNKIIPARTPASVLNFTCDGYGINSLLLSFDVDDEQYTCLWKRDLDGKMYYTPSKDIPTSRGGVSYYPYAAKNVLLFEYKEERKQRYSTEQAGGNRTGAQE